MFFLALRHWSKKPSIFPAWWPKRSSRGITIWTFKALQKISTEVKEINKDISNDVAEISKDLQTVADEITQLAATGVKTDLEAKAKELGYSSFGEAVEAYNKQHGTSYTEETAKEALGQN